MSQHFQEDILVVEDRTYRVRYFYDEDHDHPWQNDCGVGIVTDWLSDRNDKKPGWRPLHTDGRSTRYYDWAGTIAKAKADGWGLSDLAKEALRLDLGREPTKGEVVERAVQKDFEFLRAYGRNEWYYVGIEVTAVIDDEPDEDLQDTCWGFESWEDYHLEAAGGMVVDLDARVVQDLAARAAKEERDASIRELARAQTGAHEVYDDAHVDEVDDGYWVTAKIFVPKE